MTNLSDYDRRQYERMRTAISDYEAKGTTFATLVRTIDALIGALEKVPSSDRDDLLREWGALEEIYALSLDERKPELEFVHVDVISKAIANLKEIISRRIGS